MQRTTLGSACRVAAALAAVFAFGVTACAGKEKPQRRAAAAALADPGYTRPFGPNAPWNRSVAGLPRHPESAFYAGLLWNDSADRPGNINLGFESYTYPVYEAEDAEGWYPIRTRWETRIAGTQMPWNPEWQAAPGKDAQVIVLDPEEGLKWDLFQVSFDGETVVATNGSVVDDYMHTEGGNFRSRGSGIPYLAMLVRPEEIANGRIDHALSLPIHNTSGEFFVPPATKLEFPDHPPGVPEGMRFALDVTDAEIDAWIDGLPKRLPPETLRSARVIAEALRDYGWFITDTSGSAHFQFEANLTAGDEWAALGLSDRTVGGQVYPRDLLDGLLTEERIYTIVPSDRY